MYFSATEGDAVLTAEPHSLISDRAGSQDGRAPRELRVCPEHLSRRRAPVEALSAFKSPTERERLGWTCRLARTSGQSNALAFEAGRAVGIAPGEDGEIRIFTDRAENARSAVG